MKQQKNSSSEDYRKKYCDYYNIKADSSFEIHHIDFNHSNNDISNLVLIPKDLHQKYHNLINELGGLREGGSIKADVLLHTNVSNYHCDLLIELGNVIRELNKFMMKKALLDAERTTFRNGKGE